MNANERSRYFRNCQAFPIVTYISPRFPRTDEDGPDEENAADVGDDPNEERPPS
jgi:hypothetical protein